MSHVSRRQFLARMSSLAAVSLLGSPASRLVQAAETAEAIPAALPELGSRPTTEPIAASLKSIVAHIRAREVVAGARIHQPLLRDMIAEGIQLATGTTSAADAWNQLLAGDDVIGIKFNQIGGKVLRTTEVFAIELVESLKRAGFAPDRIMLIEAPHKLIRRLKTRPRPFGFTDREVHFNSGSDRLVSLLDEVTALINVPFYKTHNLAAMTGCLKNLSHALVRSPKNYHANACTPYVGDIVSLPQISDKLKINIVNALRAVFDGGPAPGLDGVWVHGGIVVGTDPVATDQIGVELINAERTRRGLSPIGDILARIPHIHHAAEIGVGTDDQDYIELLAPPLF